MTPVKTTAKTREKTKPEAKPKTRQKIKPETKQEAKSETKSEIKKPAWLKFSDKEIEAIILKLAKQGFTSEKIGLILRDQYGIPKAKLFGNRIGKVLKEHNLYTDTDMKNLEKKKQTIEKHLEKNKQDKRAKRALTITTARISKHKKYKKRKENK